MRWLFGLLACCLLGCEVEKQTTVRPRQYPRAILPDKEYSETTIEQCAFKLSIPARAKVIRKEKFFDGLPEHPCWFDIHYPDLKATIHCSYYDISPQTTFDKLVDDAYTMVSKHNTKASYREEHMIQNKTGSQGIIFDIKGPVATPYQFYITDKEKHFFRGSLYFDEKMKRDSMQPYIEFIKKDIEYLLSTLEWNS